MYSKSPTENPHKEKFLQILINFHLICIHTRKSKKEEDRHLCSRDMCTCMYIPPHNNFFQDLFFAFSPSFYSVTSKKKNGKTEENFLVFAIKNGIITIIHILIYATQLNY